MEIIQKTEIYNETEIRETAKLYFNGDELASTTWLNKYALKDKEGLFIESTPDDMHMRMAKEFHRIEKKYEENFQKDGISEYGKKRKMLTLDKIFQYFEKFKYIIPQGSVMASLGSNSLSSLSNCIVVPPVEDSYGGIMYTDQQLAQLFKRRCGVGVDISKLRPSGAFVENSAATTTGAVSFMERFSNTTREVAQNGRRGALMITMDIAHPDVEQFIEIKKDLKKVTGANISIRISDEFMKCVEKNKDFMLRFPIDSETPKIKKTVKAKELWDRIIRAAHGCAEPGIIFWDKQHKYSTSSVYPGYENSSTNPCSEIAMQGGDSCRLIAINLYSLVKKPFTKNAEFDYNKLYEIAYEGQRLNDDLVDLELEAIERILEKIKNDPEPEHLKLVETQTWKLLYDTGKKGRRTGLGFTALADVVAALGLKFDSDKSLEIIDKIMNVKMRGEFDSSIDMSITRGKFKEFDARVEEKSEFVQMLKKEHNDLYQRMMTYGRRNISLSTVAPTGTLSLLAQCSSGIEPVFMLSYKRRRKINEHDKEAKIAFIDDTGDAFEEFIVYHPRLKEWMDITGETDIQKSPYFGSTANDIDWEKRVALQSIIQKYTTHSISSTINLPSDVSEDRVSQIYMDSWRKGLKGITVYRDGSRSGVLVSTQKKPKNEKIDNQYSNILIKRPKKIDAQVIRFQNDYEKWIAVIGFIDDKPYEIFTGKMEDAFNLPSHIETGWVIKEKIDENENRYDFQYEDKQGYKVTIEGLSRSFNKEYWNYAKMISAFLRNGVPVVELIDIVQSLNLYDAHINTWKNGVVKSLKKFIPDGSKPIDKKCPNCGDPDGLFFEEGCLKCKSCGDSKCG